jgi:hypothetical protein
MIEHGTYINIFRKMLKWEWFTDSKTVHLFLYCLIKANHKPKIWQGINIERGQFITSLATIKEETGISVQSARTCIKRLISTQEITSISTSKNTLITVLKYDSYQIERTDINTDINIDSNKRSTNDQQTINKRPTTTNKENNLNKRIKTINKTKEEEAHPLRIFISENLPNVSKLKTQMTNKNCVDIIETFKDKDLIKTTLESMENNKKTANKTYQSVYLTLKNWLKRETKQGRSSGRFEAASEFTEEEMIEIRKDPKIKVYG